MINDLFDFVLDSNSGMAKSPEGQGVKTHSSGFFLEGGLRCQLFLQMQKAMQNTTFTALI